MEGAGLWDTIPTIVVKGVCNYADSHKNKKWQRYAAATAATCTKGILKEWFGKRVENRLGDQQYLSFVPIGPCIEVKGPAGCYTFPLLPGQMLDGESL
ncbi:hypothetical protein N7495_006576 [Penicillium taxi]|uniref:uncharacterized protein n=1 Tax=Penicillium taxi TaxID=168475 RepID=UPI002545769C|nr:uncharacterized protein N7495_006576 [Penicillium taxi]KAJ5894885.1 hypothetical protein N7495_006576 [Penicillium taxi]